MIRTDGGALVAVGADAHGAPAEGVKVVVAVRPEKLVVGAPGTSHSPALPARVEAVVYVGTAVHYHLRAATGERLIAYRQNDAAAPVALAPGAEVVVSWPATAARLLPDVSG